MDRRPRCIEVDVLTLGSRSFEEDGSLVDEPRIACTSFYEIANLSIDGST